MLIQLPARNRNRHPLPMTLRKGLLLILFHLKWTMDQPWSNEHFVKTCESLESMKFLRKCLKTAESLLSCASNLFLSLRAAAERAKVVELGTLPLKACNV
jgi:hypothetical protein